MGLGDSGGCLLPPLQDSQPWGLELMQFQAIEQGMGPLALGCLHPRPFHRFQMSPHVGLPGHQENGESQRSSLGVI